MAYVEKYYIDYCDDFGTSKRVSILQRDYVGASVQLLADVNPFTLIYDTKDDFKFTALRPSAASINMIFGSGDGIDFDEFWTSDDKEWQIKHIIGVSLDWIGYVTNDGFGYELKGGLYYAKLTATDGLKTLEGIAFTDDNQKPYGNQDLTYNNGFEFPLVLVFTEILRKLDLDLDLWVCVDAYEKSMTTTGDVRAAEPLANTYVNVKTYIKQDKDKSIPYWYGSGEEWNCLDVLENGLVLCGAKLYQQDGVWRVKTINSDVDYGTGATQRYWRKYNTAAVYLPGYEVVDEVINIPCGDSSKFLKENDHQITMDESYKAFRMNYEYTLLRQGDSPLNLIPNGDFQDFTLTSETAAPLSWFRSRSIKSLSHIRVTPVTITSPEDAGGNTKAIDVGTQTGATTDSTVPYMAPLISLRMINLLTSIKTGDKLNFNIWCNIRHKHTEPSGRFGAINTYRAAMFRLIIVGLDDKGNVNLYFLVNSRNPDYPLEWEKSTGDNIYENTSCFALTALNAKNWNEEPEVLKWYEFRYDLPEAPISGRVTFMIHGLGSSVETNPRVNRDDSGYSDYIDKKKYGWYFPVSSNISGSFRTVLLWYSVYSSESLQVTGAFLGLIPSGNEIPEELEYVYDNTNTNHFLTVDPITVYNGDDEEVKHISGIKVPTNVSGIKNFWDDLSGSYGYSSIGLLVVRQIMRQYQKSYRIFEGDVKVQSAKFGAVYTFEAIPNVRFIMQRGDFNSQKQYIEGGTFIQISDDILPDGGTENGGTIDPIWEDTGNVFCETSGGVNTGYVIQEEQDVNPNSETYQDTREVVSVSQDLIACPLGDPRQFYFASDDISLDTGNLVFTPYNVAGNTVTFSYNNTDGNYLYFVTLKSLGVVEGITTDTSLNNVLEDWVELSDITINGYIYRVLRTDYTMGEFTEFTHYFEFNNL